MSTSALRVGDLARRTGLSVRTLHYYEEIGLLVPSHRSLAGHRLYGPDDVARLHRIAGLRGLGLSLEQVADCLRSGDPPLLEILERQLARVREQIAAEQVLCARLEQAAARVRAGDDVTVDQLMEDIEVMTMIEKYYTQEQLATLSTRADALGPAGMQAAQQAWATLHADIRAAVAAGEPPRGPVGQALLARWQALIDAFTGGDPGIRASLDAMYRQEPAMRQRSGGDPAIDAFLTAARADPQR